MRYMRAAIQVSNTNDTSRIAAESHTCVSGTPNGSLIIIATGEVKGIIDSHCATAPLGDATINGDNTIDSISGMVIGSTTC